MPMNPSHKSYSKEEITAKIFEYQNDEGNEELATELLLHFEPMVRTATGKLSRNHRNLYDDLFQIGQITLLRCLRTYDDSFGAPFEGYAMKSLIGMMKNYLRDKSWYIQVPRKIKEKGTKIQQVIDELTMKLERSPELFEIADQMEMTVEETIEVLAGRDSYQYVSLEMPLQEEGSTTLGDMIQAVGDEYQQMDARLDIQEALVHLKKDEQKVVQLVFVERESQREIANAMGVSQMTVSRIQQRAVKKLKGLLDPPVAHSD
jgi:RNA polymerase sigma-B factor